MSILSYYDLSIGLSAVVTVLSATNIVINLQNKGLKRITTLGVVIIVLVVFTLFCNYKQHNIEKEERRISDSTNKAQYDSVYGKLIGAKDSLVIVSGNIRDIKTALTEKGLMFDSIKKTIANNNSQNVTSNNQKGGTTGFNITNNH